MFQLDRVPILQTSKVYEKLQCNCTQPVMLIGSKMQLAFKNPLVTSRSSP